MNRKNFLKNSLIGAAVIASPNIISGCKSNKEKIFNPGGDYFKPYLNLKSKINSAVIIEKITLLRKENDWILKISSNDGAVGTILTDSRIPHFLGILENLIIPYFIGKDARDIELLVDGVYRHGRNYKFAGLPLWDCIAHVELAAWDMLGITIGKPVHSLLGSKLREELDIYLSSLDRKTNPDEEVNWLSEVLQNTNARAVKYKIGGRMSYNNDSIPGRSEKLIPLARKVFGDEIHLFVDGNGSYDAEHGIKWSRCSKNIIMSFLKSLVRGRIMKVQGTLKKMLRK